MTASASGLDPDISLAAAAISGRPRRAGARPGPGRVHALVMRTRTRPLLGIFGEPRVNVLELNLPDRYDAVTALRAWTPLQAGSR